MTERLRRSELPTAADWEEALCVQWARVRESVEEPQAFFRLAPADVRQYIRPLSEALERACSLDTSIFQTETLRRLDDQQSNLRQLRQSQQTSASAMAAALDTLQASVTRWEQGSTADTAAGRFHAEIDAASKNNLSMPDVAIAALQQLRDRYEDQMSPRERFRVLANLGHAFEAKEDYDTAARYFIDCRSHQPEDANARCLQAAGYLMLGEHVHARELSEEIVALHPSSALGWALWCRCETPSVSFEAIEAAVAPLVLRIVVNRCGEMGCGESRNCYNSRVAASVHLPRCPPCFRTRLPAVVICPAAKCCIVKRLLRGL